MSTQRAVRDETAETGPRESERACQSAVRQAEAAVRQLAEQREEQERHEREQRQHEEERLAAQQRARDAEGLGYNQDYEDDESQDGS